MDIKIADKIYPLKFGFSAMIDFCREQNFELDDFGQWVSSLMDKNKLDLKKIEQFCSLIHHGIKCGCYYEKVAFDLDKRVIVDFIFENDVMVLAFGELLKSMPTASKKNDDHPTCSHDEEKKK